MTVRLGDEVRDALAVGLAVVGLETSVIGQGLPSPRNRECVEPGRCRRSYAAPAPQDLPSAVERRSAWQRLSPADATR